MARRSSGPVGRALSTVPSGIAAMTRLDDAGQIGLLERFGEELGHLGQAALAVEPVDGVARGRP